MAAPRTTLEDLRALASRDGRVCPRPDAWRGLYDRLPHTRQDAYGAIPSPPLSLDAWNAATDEARRERLLEHFAWAAQHGALAALHDYLDALPESAWHHVGD